MDFFGIPVVIDPFMLEDQIWLVTEGRSTRIHVHEGPQAGETVTAWLSKPRVVKIVNLGDWRPQLPREFPQLLGEFP